MIQLDLTYLKLNTFFNENKFNDENSTGYGHMMTPHQKTRRFRNIRRKS